MERALHDFCRPFAVYFPGAGAVDGFAIYLQPGTNLAKNALHFIRNGAVGAGTNIDQQIAVLADDVHKLMNDHLGRLEAVVFDEAPGFVADGRVRLPVERANVV